MGIIPQLYRYLATTPDRYSCFGKRATDVEFVQFGERFPEAQCLDSLIQSLFQRLCANRSATSLQDFGEFHFISQTPQGICLGKVIPSADKSGREYPLAVIVKSQQQHYQQQIFLLPYRYHELYDLSLNSEPGSLPQRIEATLANVPDKATVLSTCLSDLRSLSVGDYLTACPFQASETGFIAVLSGNIKKILANDPLCLPLPNDQTVTASVAFWLYCFSHSMTGDTVQVIWRRPPNASAAWLYLWQSPVTAERFSELLVEQYALSQLVCTDTVTTIDEARHRSLFSLLEDQSSFSHQSYF